MEVPLLDLKAQFAPLRHEVLSAVTEVLDSQLVCNGPAVRQFEKVLAEYCRAGAAVGVSSGTDALLLTLMALEIGPGDEVITTPFTFFATAGTIWRTGAKPVFVDIEPDTFNIDPSKIEAAVTPRTKAIMPVHLYGQVAQMDAIMDIAKKHGLYVIEDAAQAIGATYDGHMAGTIGHAGCLSFYPTKNLGAMGDAGAIITMDKDLAAKMEKFRLHGMSNQYYHKWVGGNFRMDSIQGAVLTIKIGHLEDWTEKHRANAALYDEMLAGCPDVKTPAVRPGRRHIYHQYVIRSSKRDALQAFLKQNGIASGVYYPLGLHMQECFKPLGYKQGDFPQTECATQEVLALPVCAELTPQHIQYVAGKIREFSM